MERLNKHQAFTLIELLVVISIIAILMSIMMPALSMAKKQAKRVICSSNNHQVGVTHLAYANDYGQWIPRFTTDSGKEVHVPIGQEIVAVIPYFMGEKVYQTLKTGYGIEAEFWVCPSLRSKGAKHRGILNDLNGEYIDFSQEDLPNHKKAPYPRIMGIANLVGLINMTDTEPKTVEECAQKPTDRSDKILAADLNIRWDNDWNNQATVIAHPGKSKNGVVIPDGSNRLYVDGSVEWVDADEMGPERDDGKTLLSDPRINGKYDHWPPAGRDYFW